MTQMVPIIVEMMMKTTTMPAIKSGDNIFKTRCNKRDVGRVQRLWNVICHPRPPQYPLTPPPPPPPPLSRPIIYISTPGVGLCQRRTSFFFLRHFNWDTEKTWPDFICIFIFMGTKCIWVMAVLKLRFYTKRATKVPMEATVCRLPGIFEQILFEICCCWKNIFFVTEMLKVSAH